jgi:transcriptional regulator with XRE-family HTH domain
MKINSTAILVKSYGMTVEEIAAAVKASASAVRNWRNGKEPRPIYRDLIARLLEEKRKAA